MICEGPEECLESIVSLFMSMEGRRDEALSARNSARNIARNVVRVMGFRGKAKNNQDGSCTKARIAEGSGLMLTADGWVITAYHNIARYIHDWEMILKKHPPTNENIGEWMKDMTMKYAVVSQQGKAYPVDLTFWRANPELDIALIKAVTLKKPKPLRFRTIQTEAKAGSKMRLMGMTDNGIYSAPGHVTEEGAEHLVSSGHTGLYNIIKNTFCTNISAEPGISGGPFVTKQGEFAGLVLCGEKGRASCNAGGAKVAGIRELVHETVYILGNDALQG
ncbi:MAG TPA: trypsin-like peptidase domain-containing protein [Nanoarchaeota archaeon]|nr:trypsin-like peptidase domain-containing protein [Nanoarchaeota archaeon]